MKAPSESEPALPQWLPDPTGQHDHRYWDGQKWTSAVGDGGHPPKVTREVGRTQEPARVPWRAGTRVVTALAVLAWLIYPVVLGGFLTLYGFVNGLSEGGPPHSGLLLWLIPITLIPVGLTVPAVAMRRRDRRHAAVRQAFSPDEAGSDPSSYAGVTAETEGTATPERHAPAGGMRA